jgi:hypothetical protein
MLSTESASNSKSEFFDLSVRRKIRRNDSKAMAEKNSFCSGFDGGAGNASDPSVFFESVFTVRHCIPRVAHKNRASLK